MKTIQTILLALLFVSTPVLTSAEEVKSQAFEPTLGQLFARQAAVEAIAAGRSIGCVVGTDVTSVRANSPFTLAWGSYGTNEPGTDPNRSEWHPVGTYTVLAPMTPATYAYKFEFFGPTGSVKCEARLTVLP